MCSGWLAAAITDLRRASLDGRSRLAYIQDVDPEFRKRALELIKYNIKIGPGKGRSYMARPAAATRLDQIKAPTLLIIGEQDISMMLDVAKALQSGIPNLTRVNMTATAHLPPMEKPDEFNRVVLDFLREK